MAFEKRAYLLDVGNRMPKESVLRRLIDRLAQLRYNELFLYADGEESREGARRTEEVEAREGARRTEGETRVDPKLVMHAKFKDVALTALDKKGLAELRGEGVAEVSTEAPRSLAGRVEEMRERMEAAEAKGKAEGVRRFLVTDLSDGHDWHSPIISLPGMVMGGYFATLGAKAAKMDLERELSQFLDAPLAGVLLRLGTLYLRGGAYREEASEYFNILSRDLGYSRHAGITDFVLNEVSTVLRGVMTEAERYQSRSESAQEILYTALLLDAACHRRSEARLKTVREEFVKMWNRHFESVGRDLAAAKIPRF